MTQINVQELYFVVNVKDVKYITEFPQTGYTSILEAIRTRNSLPNNSDFEVKTYTYIWNIVQRNLT